MVTISSIGRVLLTLFSFLDVDDGDTDMKNCDSTDEDDVPMLHLASFALHKLFTEWESQGFHIPDFKLPNPNEDGAADVVMEPEKKVPAVRTELPTGADTMHPCMLLAIVSFVFFVSFSVAIN